MNETEIDSFLEGISKTRNVMLISQALIDTMTKHKVGLDYLESRLRKLNNMVYLLARSDVPEELISRDPLTKEQMDYWLWICVNGSNEALLRMVEFNLTQEDNLEKLKRTGFLFVQ